MVLEGSHQDSKWSLKRQRGTSLAVQLRLQAPNARDSGSIPGWGTKIPHARQPKDKQQQKKLKINKKSKEAEGREVEKQLLCYHKL